MRVLVTSGTGFIGSHIVDALLAEGAQVSVLSMYPEQYRVPLRGVRYHHGSFGLPEAVSEALADRPDTVIHLGNYALSLNASGLPESDLRTLGDSVKLFERCIEHKVGKIIFVSSGGKIYGPVQSLPVQETAPTNPQGSYAITKLAIEKHLLSLSYFHGFDAVILRPSNPYGPRQTPVGAQGVIPIFAWRILHQLPITLWGDGAAIRDYIRVVDVARFCALAATRTCVGTFNLGSGVGVSTMELVDMLADLLKTQPIIKNEPARKFDVPAIVLDSSLAKKQFDWHPETDLQQGLVEVVAWLQQLALSERDQK